MPTGHSPMDHLDAPNHHRSRGRLNHDGRRDARLRAKTQSCLPAASWRCCASRFGFTFLWAFLDKTFALGFATGTGSGRHRRPVR